MVQYLYQGGSCAPEEKDISPTTSGIRQRKQFSLRGLQAITTRNYAVLDQYLSDPSLLKYCCDADQISTQTGVTSEDRKAWSSMVLINSLNHSLSQKNGFDIVFPGLVLLDPSYIKRLTTGIVLVDQYFLTKELLTRFPINSKDEDCIMGRRYSIFTKEDDIPDPETMEHYYDTPALDGEVIEDLLTLDQAPKKLIPLVMSPFQGIAELVIVYKLEKYFTPGTGLDEQTKEKYAVYGPRSGESEFDKGFVEDFADTTEKSKIPDELLNDPEQTISLSKTLQN